MTQITVHILINFTDNLRNIAHDFLYLLSIYITDIHLLLLQSGKQFLALQYKLYRTGRL